MKTLFNESVGTRSRIRRSIPRPSLTFLQMLSIYIYIYIYIILINNSRGKDKGNQWHDGGCISDTKFC